MSDQRLPILINSLVQFWREREPNRPALIGVAGAQGSGKTTLCRTYARNNPRTAYFSLDDVYKTRAEREADARHASDLIQDPRFASAPLGARVRAGADLYPLLITRGPPGTHDLGFAKGLVARLGKPLTTPLPRFDKIADDRAAETTWPVFEGPAEAILIDGWCLGAAPPPEGPPLNTVEREDWTGQWRARTIRELEGAYAQFFAAFDAMIYLQAPTWEIVRQWRGEQEEAALGRPLTPQEGLALDRFVMHYERVTRAMLEGRHRARWIVHLDEARNVKRIEERA